MIQVSALRLRISRRRLECELWGLLFTSLGILHLIWLTAYPVLASLYYSFTSYSVIGRWRWIGLQNYERLFQDPEFYNAIYNTLYLIVLGLPIGIFASFLLAILLNQRVRGLSVYRTLFYLPSILPAVATAVLWTWIFHPTHGLLNIALQLLGIVGPNWLADPAWAKPALIVMGLWGAGGSTLVFLAGLQDVPQELYDAAMVDGAGRWAKFRYITIPFMSPYLFFSLVTGLIGGFQAFTSAYVLTFGGPVRSTVTYVFYLWENGFSYLKMGYACALAWVLFVVIVVFTLITFHLVGPRVYYAGR